MSIESVVPSNHLILHCPLLLLPSIIPTIRVFSNELPLCSRWPKYWKEIIGGTESKPHSRPCMACGGFLIRRVFVLTAAHCAGTRHQRFTLSFFSLTRVCNSHPRSHNRKQKEDTWQRLEVKTVSSSKIRTFSWSPRHLFTFIRPGRMCWVAGWGKNRYMELRIVKPRACSLFPAFDHNLQLCVGHPQSTKSAFKGADTFGR
ncbi:hypothetical protein FD754_025135, partial [Muntiacus muntjak]